MGIVLAATRAPPVKQSTLPGSQNIIKETTCATFNVSSGNSPLLAPSFLSLSHLPLFRFLSVSASVSASCHLLILLLHVAFRQPGRAITLSLVIIFPIPQQADPTTPAKTNLKVQKYAFLHIFPIASGYCSSLCSPRVSCATQGEHVIDTDSQSLQLFAETRCPVRLEAAV